MWIFFLTDKQDTITIIFSIQTVLPSRIVAYLAMTIDQKKKAIFNSTLSIPAGTLSASDKATISLIISEINYFQTNN